MYQTQHRQKEECKYRSLKKGTSPRSQIFPSHPVLHWQTNEPGVFKQVALFKQDLCKHSSTSAKRKNNHFRNHILLLHFLSIRLMFLFNMTYQLHILFHPILADNYMCIDQHCSSSHRLHRSGKDCWYTSHLCKEIISEAINFTNGRTQIKLINLLITFKWF